jgi:hypothetical protein
MFLSLGQSTLASHQQVLSLRASSRPPEVGATGSALPGGGGFTTTVGPGVGPGSFPDAVSGAPFILFMSMAGPPFFSFSEGGGGFAITPC